MEEKKVFKLDPKVKEQWVAELRSGKYKQGKGNLRKGDRYCCLGVLCEHVLHLESSEPEESGCYYFRGPNGHDSAAVIPDNAAGRDFEAGGPLNTPINVYIAEEGRNREIVSLWELNDVAGWNFNQIADVIEEQF